MTINIQFSDARNPILTKLFGKARYKHYNCSYRHFHPHTVDKNTDLERLVEDLMQCIRSYEITCRDIIINNDLHNISLKQRNQILTVLNEQIQHDKRLLQHVVSLIFATA